MRRALIVMAAAILPLSAGSAVGLYLWHGRVDAHTKAACSAVDGSNRAVTLEGSVASEIRAISEASKSSEPSLRRAAATKSLTTQLPPDDPQYENPVDLQFRAVSAWCAQH